MTTSADDLQATSLTTLPQSFIQNIDRNDHISIAGILKVLEEALHFITCFALLSDSSEAETE